MTFRELQLNEGIIEGIEAMGFEEATPVQELAIPHIMDGKDLLACAQTGTGKTAAFLLPILHQLAENPTPETFALILVPTRELAIQIDQNLEGFAYFTGANFATIYGGRDKSAFNQEKKAITSGANIIVATPGRLIAHLNLGYAKLDQLSCLILDEADRMLDMGFVHDIRKIINFLPRRRQTLLFSATMPPKIKSLSKSIMHNPKFISLKTSKPAEGILQGIYKVDDEYKLPLLKHIIEERRDKEGLMLVFSRTKASVKEITSTLKRAKLPCAGIHSDLEQDERTEVLRLFKNGQSPILVATDILSRGIDVKNIDLVINYDVPTDEEDYIHRVGRTARAKTEGTAITFISGKDARKFKRIEDLIQSDIKTLELPSHIPPRSANGRSRNQKSGNRRYSGKNNTNRRSHSKRSSSNGQRRSSGNRKPSQKSGDQ